MASLSTSYLLFRAFAKRRELFSARCIFARAYVAIPQSNTVAVIDAASQAAEEMAVSGGPNGVAVVPEYQPITIPVSIDIRPGKFPNKISPHNPREVVPVAILTTTSFDASSVRAATVRSLSPASAERACGIIEKSAKEAAALDSGWGDEGDDARFAERGASFRASQRLLQSVR